MVRFERRWASITLDCELRWREVGEFPSHEPRSDSPPEERLERTTAQTLSTDADCYSPERVHSLLSLVHHSLAFLVHLHCVLTFTHEMPSDQSTWLIAIPQDGDADGTLQELHSKLASTTKSPGIAQLPIPALKVPTRPVHRRNPGEMLTDAPSQRQEPSSPWSHYLKISQSRTQRSLPRSQRPWIPCATF